MFVSLFHAILYCALDPPRGTLFLDMPSVGLKYPFMQTQTSLWKNCQKIDSRWRSRSKKHVVDFQRHFTTSAIDYSNVFRLPNNETELENMKVLSTQQAFGIEFIKNEIIVSKCAGSKTGSVFHLGGLPGAGKTATITSLIEELADVNMTGKGSVMMITKTNAAKFNLLSACVDPNTENEYFHESKFVTVNSGFAVPVLKTCAVSDDRMIESYAGILEARFQKIALSDIVVMDEYTMTGCYDTLYMDCLMRTVTGRHDVPFGGTPIIFLGDNRQNSAVIDNCTTAACKNEKNLFMGEENGSDGATAGAENNSNSITSKVFMGILSRFHGGPNFFDNFMSVCRTRREAISDRLKYVSEHLDRTIRLYDQKKEESLAPTITSKRKLGVDVGQQQQPVPEKKQKKEESTLEEETETEYSDEMFFTNETEMEMVALAELYDDPPKARMTNRLQKLEAANLFFRKQVTGKERKMGSCNLARIKNAGFGLLREEALRSELDYLDRFLSCPSKDEVKRRVMDVMYDIRNFARMAFSEIDNTGRKRMYILSAMTDVIPNCHVISLANEEIINIKLSCGRDKYCLDSVECFKELGDEETRISNTSDAVMNAFFRTGDEVKYRGSLCQAFKENLENILDYLEKVTTFEELKDLAKFIMGDDLSTFFPLSTTMNRDDGFKIDDDLDSDDEDFFGDDNGEAEDLIVRKDAPPEIGFNMRTSERVKKMIEFVPVYHSIVDRYSDISRARMWHVYLLARNLQTLNTYKSCITSPFSKKSASTQLEKEFHEPYWIRALSLPTSSSTQTKNLQSAYSAFLSLNSRTFLMSSQKRISISRHALGMMYSLSLFDMTVDLNTLIDSRDVFGSKPLIGCSSNLSHEDYFETIFPSIMSEFLIVSQKSVSVELNEIQKAEGNKIDLRKINDVINKMKNNRQGLDEKSVYIGASLLASIARDNILFNKRQKRFEEESKDLSLKDRLVSKKKRPATIFQGAIALTRKNEQKNMISNLVDMTIKASQEEKTNNCGPMSVSFKTEFSVGHVNLTNVEFDVGARNRATIMGLCDEFNKRGKVFIDQYVDANLRRTSTNQREFTKQLLKIRNDVTKVRTIEFFVGQTVTFTHSNTRNFSPYHCNDTMFYTTDTGTIVDMCYKDGKLVLSIMIHRTGKIANVRAGNETFGSLHNGRYGAHVRYFPVSSSRAVTFYSSQGHTYRIDVIVDVSHASTQDTYVALTRNEDVLQLKVMSLSDSKLRRLVSIKACMGQDKTTLFPIGALRGTRYVDVIDFLQLFNARNSFAGDKISNDQIRLQHAIRDTARDLVSTAQSFVMDLSGNSFSFNTEWMKNTGIILSRTGLCHRLEKLENAFFDRSTPRSVIDTYNSKTNNTLMQLYVCTVRAALHYMLNTNVKKPAQSVLKDYMTRTSNLGYVKIHPAFINRPMLPENIEYFFFDLAPHSFVTKIFQFYAHFIFMVYEQCHMCLTSFSFIPSESPVFNASVRVNVDKKTLDDIQGKSERTDLVRLFIPGGGLAYEPKEFEESMDGYIRLERDAVTKADYNSDTVRNEISSYVVKNVNDADRAMARCGEYQKKNLRRKGKYCRPGEAVGLSKHGAIAVACDKESLTKANIHIMDEEWASFSNEANLYGMLRFMTKLAAASGVTAVDIDLNASKFPNEGFRIDDLSMHGYSVNMSSEVLYCGQCDPFLKVQFLIHCFKKSKSSIKNDVDSCDCIFGKMFEKGLTRGRGFRNCLKVIMTTDNFSHKFISSVKTSDVRNSLFMGIGKVRKEEVTSLDELEKLVVRSLSQKKFNRLSFFISAKI